MCALCKCAVCIHLSVHSGFSEARIEGARRVDGVLARERGVRRSDAALPKPGERDLSAAFALFM